MPLLTDNMSEVPSPTDVVDEGWYHVRITEAEVGTAETSGLPVVKLQLKVQNEGPMLGRIILDTVTLQSHALWKLKGYYNSIGYFPGREGHDPDKLIDGEMYVYAMHDMYNGQPTIKIPPYSIRSLHDGPGKNVPKKKSGN
jgi:hypothetical protein